MILVALDPQFHLAVKCAARKLDRNKLQNLLLSNDRISPQWESLVLVAFNELSHVAGS